ncbi:hypothetical protein ACLOJK_019876 [Asimina triloba]
MKGRYLVAMDRMEFAGVEVGSSLRNVTANPMIYYSLLRRSTNLGMLISNAMAALVGCVGSNGLLVGRDEFSPDLKQKKMATIVDGDGAVVDFKQMLSIAASRSVWRKKKTPTIAS